MLSEILDWVHVEEGHAVIGCMPNECVQCELEEQPSLTVFLDEFWITKYPVTNRIWNRLVDGSEMPGREGNSDCPVTCVRWHDCFEFAKHVSKLSEEEVTIPTEFEWEKSARGPDSQLLLRGGVFEQSQLDLCENYELGPLSIFDADFGPCGYGLSNVWTNVSEWCSNWYSEDDYAMLNEQDGKPPLGPKEGEFKCFRGGNPLFLGWPRLSCRSFQRPNFAGDFLGFRLVKRRKQRS